MLWQKCHEMLRKRTAYFPTLTEASVEKDTQIGEYQLTPAPPFRPTVL